MPQWPSSQAAVWHSLLARGQSLASRHWAHWPAGLHLPLPLLHGVPGAAIAALQTPLVHAGKLGTMLDEAIVHQQEAAERARLAEERARQTEERAAALEQQLAAAQAEIERLKQGR